MNMYDGTCIKEDIEDIFPQLAENDDERIRKGIVETIKQCPDTFLNPKNRDKMLAYLEKQKSVEWNDADMREARGNLISVCRDWERGKLTTLLPLVATRARYFLEHLIEPQKPAEWSEEDYHWEGLVQLLRDYQKTIDRNSNNMAYEDVERYIGWVNSLRPQPKKEWSEEEE